MTLYERILDALKDIDRDELCYIWARYCDEANRPDDQIYSMDDFEEMFALTNNFELVRMCFYGNFNPSDNYFKFNGYGNLDSTDFPADWMDLEEVAALIIRDMDSFDNDEIQDILDEYEERENEDEETDEVA